MPAGINKKLVQKLLSDETLDRLRAAEFSNAYNKIAQHDRNVEIIRRYRNGERALAIAEDYGISQCRVNGILHQYIRYAVRLKMDFRSFLRDYRNRSRA